MPCRVDSPDSDTQAKNKKKINKLERLLCSSCTVLERDGYNFAENPELDRWWHQHKQADEARALAEAVKNKEIEHVIELLKKPAGELTREEWTLIKKHAPAGKY